MTRIEFATASGFKTDVGQGFSPALKACARGFETSSALSARVVAILAAALLTSAALSAAPAPPQDQSTVKDPVCGMSVRPPDAKFKSEYGGRTYYFCSEGCKQKFDKEPAKYAAPKKSGTAEQPAKDPVCGMAVKPADAKFKSEYQGKTYYFCSEGCKQKFDREPARYVGK